jgi:hypothetical protein
MHILIGLGALVVWFIGIIGIGVGWKVYGIAGDKHDTKR